MRTTRFELDLDLLHFTMDFNCYEIAKCIHLKVWVSPIVRELGVYTQNMIYHDSSISRLGCT